MSKRRLALSSVLALAILFAFTPSLRSSFVSDDYDWLRLTRDSRPIQTYFTTNYFGTRDGGSYTPMLSLLFTFEQWAFGLHPLPFHIFGVLLHLLNTGMIFVLMFQFVKKRSVAFASAMIFGLLPSHSEAVTWIAAVPHVLVTSWYLGALLCFTRFFSSHKWSWYVGVLLCTIGALLTKESAITLPITLILLGIIFPAEEKQTFTLRRAVLPALLPIVFVLVYLLLRAWTTGVLFGYYGRASLDIDITAMFKMYVESTIGILFSHPWRVTLTSFVFEYRWFFLLLLFLFLWVLARTKEYRRFFFFFGGGYVVSLLPFLQLLWNQHNTEGERYTYLASVFFVPILMVCCFTLFKKFRHAAVLLSLGGIVVVGFMGLSLFQKNKIWQEAGTIADRILESYSTLAIEPDDALLFIGIPDNLYGAQVFRNALKEALVLYGLVSRDAQTERLGAYTMLDRENSHAHIVDVEKTSSTSIALIPKQEGVRIFTGFPKGTHPFGTFFLENFQRDHTGSDIRVEFEEEKLEALRAQGRRLLIVYFDEGKLRMYAVQ